MTDLENITATAVAAKPKRRPSVQYLRSILSLDRDAGVRRWKVNRGPMRPGDTAGYVVDGKVLVTVDGQQHDASLVAFLLVRDALVHRGRGHPWRSATKAGATP
jgi:hypothetical protein